MAGTIEPIAALTTDDRGPINTIASIILPSVTILFSIIRVVVSREKRVRLELDDVVFGVTLCLGVTSSIMSHFCVRAGLGRHQDKLDDEQVERYFKLFWMVQFLGIIALGGAKLSIVLMFQRIDPVQLGRTAVKWLIPIVGGNILIALFLVGFQCQLPRPWVLSPKNCSTHGNVYYPITIFNILTDVLLSFWILPVLWRLQMNRHTKNIVTWLFVSRFIICIVDMGRMVVIHKALKSEDQTRSQLLWAVMDQIVIHLSINHATLPRIQIFLSNLQTGLLAMQIPTAYSNSRRTGNTRPAARHDVIPHLAITTRSDRTKSNLDSHLRSKSSGRWSWLNTQFSSVVSKAPSISECPLRLQPELGIELSTTVHVGDGSSMHSEGNKSRSYETLKDGVRVKKEIRMAYDDA